MNSRKLNPGPPAAAPSLAPRGLTASALTKPSSVLSQEYQDALKTLSDETLTEACALLLSERDYEESEQHGKSDYERLLEIHQKCKIAAQVVEREAPVETVNINTAPSIPGGPRALLSSASRSQAKALGKPTSVTKPMVVLPNRRMTTRLPPTKLTAKRSAPMERQTSDSSTSSLSSMERMRQTKVPRLASAPKIPETKPPPSALNFLAKLNKDSKEASPATKRVKAEPTKPVEHDDDKPASEEEEETTEDKPQQVVAQRRSDRPHSKKSLEEPPDDIVSEEDDEEHEGETNNDDGPAVQDGKAKETEDRPSLRVSPRRRTVGTPPQSTTKERTRSRRK